MKYRNNLIELFSMMLLLLFIYTASSKLLDYDKFVFQMRLAPVPLMTLFAPILGWLIPGIEIIIVAFLAIGLFKNEYKTYGLYASVILLSAFEVYIAIMLLSNSNLPCTCGGIISKMGWKQHLLFNAFFILGGGLSLRYFQKNKALGVPKNGADEHKILSRA